ncbi:hypothetical protein ACFY5F_29285 [Streptomyces sp. NPDC013161]
MGEPADEDADLRADQQDQSIFGDIAQSLMAQNISCCSSAVGSPG